MALSKHIDDRTTLIQQAAREVAALNRHIQAPLAPYTDEEYAALQSAWARYDEEVAAPLGQIAEAKGYSASDAVQDDRGD